MKVALNDAVRLVAEWEASGLSMQSFAEAHHMPRGCISRYRRRLKRASGESAADISKSLFQEIPPLMDGVVPAAVVVLGSGCRVELSLQSSDACVRSAEFVRLLMVPAVSGAGLGVRC